MPSNELTWALCGMAIVAAPIVAVWLWRWLGRGKGPVHLPGGGISYKGYAFLMAHHAEKPAPYAQSAKALGSKSQAPWVTRDEFDALALDVAGVSQVLSPIDAIIDDIASANRRLDALEAKEPEAGRGGYRVFAKSDFTWVWDGGSLYVRSDTWPWTPSGYSGITQLYEQIAGVFELHGKDADRIVAEFLEWRRPQ